MFHGTGTGKSFFAAVIASIDPEKTILSGIGDVAVDQLMSNIANQQRIPAARLNTAVESIMKRHEANLIDLLATKTKYLEARRELWISAERIKNNSFSLAAIETALDDMTYDYQIKCLDKLLSYTRCNLTNYQQFRQTFMPLVINTTTFQQINDAYDILDSLGRQVASKLTDSLEVSL